MDKDAGLYAWIKREEASSNIYQEVDGYWVWAPQGCGGFLNEYALSKMVEYLAARNAFWTWQIQNDPAIGSVPQKGLTTEDQLERALDARMVPKKGVESKQPDKYAAHQLACITRVTGGLEGPCDCGVESNPQKGVEE